MYRLVESGQAECKLDMPNSKRVEAMRVEFDMEHVRWNKEEQSPQ